MLLLATVFSPPENVFGATSNTFSSFRGLLKRMLFMASLIMMDSAIREKLWDVHRKAEKT